MIALISLVALIIVATLTVYVGSHLSLDQISREEPGNAENRLEPQETVELSYAQILIMPLSSSVCLLVLFYFFAYLQYFMIGILVLGATGALFQVSQFYLHRYISTLDVQRSGIIALILTVIVTFEWLRTGNFLAHDLLGCALCVVFISTIKFPSLKLAVLCLTMLVVYDIFWVFFSEYIFKQNVMVSVATKVADNPIHQITEHITTSKPMQNFFKSTIELPIKLIFPGEGTRLIMLGLGDIALPGAFVALALRCDVSIAHFMSLSSEHENDDNIDVEKQEKQSLLSTHNNIVHTTTSLSVSSSTVVPFNITNNNNSASKKEDKSRVSITKTRLFEYSIAGYFFGLMCAFVGNTLSGHPQPALIYLVPGVLIPFVCRAYYCNVLHTTWIGLTKMEQNS